MLMALVGIGCGGDETTDPRAAGNRHERVANAVEWMYQIQGLDEAGAVAALSDTPYPLLVLEPGHNFRPCSDDFNPADYGITGPAEDACADPYDTAAMVEALRTASTGEERLLIAYIDIGQAEVYRDYWAQGWAEPQVDAMGMTIAVGEPDYILAGDPDSWAGNFVVAYWDERWQSLWDDIVADIARAGFDGVYLDWVEAYDDDRVVAAADGIATSPKRC